ncbi:MAG: DUF4202 domain-containing protein [Actinomycetia bacterium]|nr:DUF4202 domain-containing protein [Actinomycetes bacterium]
MAEPVPQPAAGELTSEQFDAVIAAIDEANSADPNVLTHGARRGPKELVHAEMMTEWVHRLSDAPDQAQLVAARAHHLCRWEHPRADYDEGRAGYRRWRAAAKKAHAEAVAGILEAHGAPAGFIDRVQRTIRKDGLGADPSVQLHEDALCLVFLETQLDDLVESLGEQRATEVLGSTLRKMTPAGVAAAGTIELSEMGRSTLSCAIDAVNGPQSQ